MAIDNISTIAVFAYWLQLGDGCAIGQANLVFLNKILQIAAYLSCKLYKYKHTVIVGINSRFIFCAEKFTWHGFNSVHNFSLENHGDT